MLSFSYKFISGFNSTDLNEGIQWIFFPSTLFQNIASKVFWTQFALHQLSHRKDTFFLASWINLKSRTHIGLIKCHLSEKQNNKIVQ